MLGNYGVLAQTRQPGFDGPGSLRLSDILALYEIEGWVEADMSPRAYIDTMLFLDGALVKFNEDHKPIKAK